MRDGPEAVALGADVLQDAGRVLDPVRDALGPRVPEEDHPGHLLLAETAHDFAVRLSS